MIIKNPVISNVIFKDCESELDILIYEEIEIKLLFKNFEKSITYGSLRA